MKKILLDQVQYEKQRQNSYDRFSLQISHQKYHECFIFFIAKHNFSKTFYFNNLEVFHHFRHFFIDKAHKLICKAENDKIVAPYKKPHFSKNNSENSIQLINQLDIRRYYICNTSSYLTKREMICASYLIRSYTTKQIAKAMNVSPRTVEVYLETIRQKLNSQERSELVRKLSLAFPSSGIFRIRE